MWPNVSKSRESKENVEMLRTLEDLVLPEHKDFADFLYFLFAIDPKKRPTAKEALKHSFFHIDFD
jgi:serine/threonine protein kinase